MNPAETSDVEARWRPLTDSEVLVASTRLDDAWRTLRRAIPDLETRMTSDADLAADTVQVLADAVIRVLQAGMREGVRKGSKGIDDASSAWELDSTVRFDLHFTAAELERLTATPITVRRAFSVMPS